MNTKQLLNKALKNNLVFRAAFERKFEMLVDRVAMMIDSSVDEVLCAYDDSVNPTPLSDEDCKTLTGHARELMVERLCGML